MTADMTFVAKLMSETPDHVRDFLRQESVKRSLRAGDVFHLLRGSSQDDVTKPVLDGRPRRAWTLLLAKQIQLGYAYVIGFRLVWVVRQGTEDFRDREGIEVLVGEEADNYNGEMRQQARQFASNTPPTFAILVERCGKTLEALATTTALSIETLKSFAAGQGKPRPNSLHMIAIALGCSIDEVARACRRSRSDRKASKATPAHEAPFAPSLTYSLGRPPMPKKISPPKRRVITIRIAMLDGQITNLTSAQE